MRQQPDQPHRTTLRSNTVEAELTGWQLALVLLRAYEYEASARICQSLLSGGGTP